VGKTYDVKVPFSGYVYVQVEAQNKEEAEEKGYKEACDGINTADKLWNSIEEWDFYKKIVEGNICYASQWEVEAEEAWGND
jgi:hypothetical protein